jgi:hypothetical protein
VNRVATPYHHALSSVKTFGGCTNDYIEIHDWFDASKAFMGDFRHRALRHHAQGIFEAERIFGKGDLHLIYNSDDKPVPVRLICEQHVIEDCGHIPSMQDWFSRIEPQPWMNSPRRLSQE